MAIREYDGVDAWKGFITNPLRNYPGRVADGAEGEDRLYPFASPTYPRFDAMPADPKVFVTGTCIARTLENQLLHAGCKVTSRDDQLSDHVESGNEFGILTKYNLPAMLNEFYWAMDRDVQHAGEVSYIEHSEGEYIDLQHGSTEIRGSIELLQDFRARFASLYAKAADADIIVIPLASIEVWYDSVAECYLNFRPTRKFCMTHPGRFSLRILDYDTLRTMLLDGHHLLRQHCKPNTCILYAVTPAATPVTFAGGDAMLETIHAKSLQRAVIQDVLLSENDPRAGYLPFWEATLLQDHRANFISKDYRHMAPEMGMRLAGQMMTTLYPDNLRYKELYAIGTSKCFDIINDAQKSFDMMDSDFDPATVSTGFLKQRAHAARRAGHHKIALECHLAIQDTLDASAQNLRYAILACYNLGESDEADRLMERFRAEYSDMIEMLEGLEKRHAAIPKRSRPKLPPELRDIMNKANALNSDGRPQEAEALFVHHEADIADYVVPRWHKFITHTKTRNVAAALDEGQRFVMDFPDHYQGLEQYLLLCMRNDQGDRIDPLIRLHKERFPHRNDFIEKFFPDSAAASDAAPST